jgi:hypothetical protein
MSLNGFSGSGTGWLEQGFEKDATATPRHPELGDGHKALVINFGFLASAVLTTDEAVKARPW